MIGGVNHRAGSDKSLIADFKSTKGINVNPIVKTYVVTEFCKLAVKPNDLVDIEAPFANSLGITRTKRNNAFALGCDHHSGPPFGKSVQPVK
jgi:hypothetical protein